MALKLRPHHVFCTVAFQGKGYSPEFVAGYSKVKALLEAEPQTAVSLSSTADAVCEPCSFRRGDGCETQEKIDRLDHAHAEALGAEDGETRPWSEWVARLRDRVTVEAHPRICAGCQWLPLGICESALRQLQQSE